MSKLYLFFRKCNQNEQWGSIYNKYNDYSVLMNIEAKMKCWMPIKFGYSWLYLYRIFCGIAWWLSWTRDNAQYGVTMLFAAADGRRRNNTRRFGVCAAMFAMNFLAMLLWQGLNAIRQLRQRSLHLFQRPVRHQRWAESGWRVAYWQWGGLFWLQRQ